MPAEQSCDVVVGLHTPFMFERMLEADVIVDHPLPCDRQSCIRCGLVPLTVQFQVGDRPPSRCWWISALYVGRPQNL
jgi:hypothetical protein